MSIFDVDLCISVADLCGSRCLLISGGEPLLHPHIFRILNGCALHMKRKFGTVVLTTNLLPAIRDARIWDRLKRLKKKYPEALQIQVTADKRFYKSWQEVKAREADIIADFEFDVCWEIPTVHSVGRAWDNRQELTDKGVHLDAFGDGTPIAPMCANPLLVARQTPNWKAYTKILESRGKFCSMMIDAYGRFHISESMCCPSYSTLTEFLNSPQKAFENLRAAKGCGRCPINTARQADELYHIFNHKEHGKERLHQQHHSGS